MKKVTWLFSAALIFNSVGAFFFGQIPELMNGLSGGLWLVLTTGLPIMLCVLLAVFSFGRENFIEPLNDAFDRWLLRGAIVIWVGAALVGGFFTNPDAFSPYLWLALTVPVIFVTAYMISRNE